MCDKVFRENSHIHEKQLIKELRKAFEVDTIIFIPTHPMDYTGHADGMVRFLDDKTVLINDFSREQKQFQITLHMALHNAGLEYIEVPYNPYENVDYVQAIGEYINYMQMDGLVFVPIFGMKEDDKAIAVFEKIFNRATIRAINCNEIAKEGGILNCITWNIKVNHGNRN